MIKIDPHDRIDLTGPWSGFGFQGGHMFTRRVTSWIPATASSTLLMPSEIAENGGWTRVMAVPTLSRPMWSA